MGRKNDSSSNASSEREDDAESSSSQQQQEEESEPSPIRRSKRKIRPVSKHPPDSPVRKKRRANSGPSNKKSQETEHAQRERLRPKRQYTKRKKKDDTTRVAVSVQKAQADQDHDQSETNSLEDSDMFCCICKCTVDYSDKDQFHWPEEVDSDDEDDDDDNDNEGEQEKGKTNTNIAAGSQKSEKMENSVTSQGNSKVDTDVNTNGGKTNKSKATSTTSSSEESDFYGVKLPNHMYDPNNALLICDGPGCNRCYHQRCHFTPVLSVPRREWFCLICQYKDKLQNQTKAKRGRKPKNASKQGSNDEMEESENIVELSKSKPLTVEEMGQIYCALPKNSDCADIREDAKPLQHSPGKEEQTTKEDTNSTAITLYDRFDFHTSQMKADLIRKGSQQMVKIIDQNLSTIRQCQNSIRTLVETNNRARKALIEKYNLTHRLPQELVQNVTRMGRCKLRLRNLFQTLQYVIQNKDDRADLFQWFLKAKSEGKFTPAKICPSKHTSKHNPPVPEVISLDMSEKGEGGQTQSSQEGGPGEQQIDIDALEAKLFVGDVVRREPRFDIKDYDADEDDSESSGGDPANKIKCCICHSGHVEDENDVVMCDGMKCFRAMHMKCCAPVVTQKMLDDDENGVWFCPFCVCFSKTIHYAQVEYHADTVDDDGSIKSWEHAEDVFPEAELELKAADKWKLGNRNDSSDEILADILGIEIAKDSSPNAHDGADDEDDDEESDDSFDASDGSKGSASISNSDTDTSGVNWDVNKELSALSCSDSESDSEDESDNGETTDAGPRRSRRLEKSAESSGVDSDSGPSAPITDVGKLDKSNIVRGKRSRAKVDYNLLNDSMFANVSKSAIDDEEEYQFVMKKDASSDSESGSGSGSDSDSNSSDDESGNEESGSAVDDTNSDKDKKDDDNGKGKEGKSKPNARKTSSKARRKS